MSAVVVGESLVDRFGQLAMSDRPGGSPANVAVTLGRLGRAVSLLTQLGSDPAGELVASWLDESGVLLADGSGRTGRTGVATVRRGPDGDQSYEFDLTWDLDSGVRLPEAAVVHAGSIAATLEPGAPVVAGLVRRARATATVTYDPNVRPSLMGEREDVVSRVTELVALADVVKVSDQDLGWLTPGVAPSAVARSWLRLGPAWVVVTCGRGGAFAVGASAEVRVEASAVDVVDTVGAGDSFMGGLIDGLWSADLLGAGKRAELQSAGPETMAAVLERGARVAGVTVSRFGADPPWRSELRESSAGEGDVRGRDGAHGERRSRKPR